ncbi:hypothetical protein ACFOG5_06730 [Pedobacter fastidiosus]|uniref:DoxX family protein n=1 Tax=Pedobacter fastidiosus TaxID=2765361 RepID=A0ABR7KUT3_9SPHI|nr:hypothetical protein [Pedobacter fastidiosus]MBC6111870.1 hypothetical protein [Pedobacter fastidiosus]
MTLSTTSNQRWSFGKRLRVLMSVYFVFLFLDFTSEDELFPHFVYVAMKFYTNFWNWLVPWTGRNILHLSYPTTVTPNGSGDTTYNYVMQLLWIVFTVIIAVIWAVADRRRPNYEKFYYWAIICVRYFLAYMLFVYGFVKVIKLQFPFPDLIRLTEPYGESSPMGLAWTFVGYSAGYNIFIGGAEVVAGILLFFKRTTLLGSLIAMTVMCNVVAMNFAYDIPVKIFSLNLLFMACWIAWIDKDRLVSFFILHNALTENPKQPIFKTKWKRVIQLSMKTIVILFAFYATLWSNLNMAKKYGDAVKKPPLYGIYDIKTFTKNNNIIAPLTTDSARWKRIIINYPGYVRITNMTDSSIWMKLKVDELRQTLHFTSNKDSTDAFVLKYKRDHKMLYLTGRMRGDSVKIQTLIFDHKKFPLVSRGFHWINEYPNNR